MTLDPSPYNIIGMGWKGKPLSVPLGPEKCIQIVRCGMNENLVDMDDEVRFNRGSLINTT